MFFFFQDMPAEPRAASQEPGGALSPPPGPQGPTSGVPQPAGLQEVSQPSPENALKPVSGADAPSVAMAKRDGESGSGNAVWDVASTVAVSWKRSVSSGGSSWVSHPQSVQAASEQVDTGSDIPDSDEKAVEERT